MVSIMERSVLLNKKGFPLIEALISIVILSLILIGLLSAMLVSYQISLKNQIRNEAIQIAREKINYFRDTKNTDIFKHSECTQATDNDAVVRRIRNINYKYFVVGKIENKEYVYELTVKVCGNDKKELYKVKTLVSK